MVSINGIGTGYRGWRHAEDGTATATLWITVVFLPVLPLRRYRLRSRTDFDAERFPRNPLVVAAALGGGLQWSDPVEIQERLPLAWKEIGGTYLWCYLLIPLLCLWPVLVGRLVFRHWLPDAGIAAPDWVHVGFAVLVLAYMGAVLAIAARRLRGAPPGR